MARHQPAQDRHRDRCGSCRRPVRRSDRLRARRDGYRVRPDRRVGYPARLDRRVRRDPRDGRRDHPARVRRRGWAGAASCLGWDGGRPGRRCHRDARLAAAASRRVPGAARRCCHRRRTGCWRYGVRAAVQPQPHGPRRIRRTGRARPGRPARAGPPARGPVGRRGPRLRPPVRARSEPARAPVRPPRPSWPEPSWPGRERSCPHRGKPREAAEPPGLRRSRTRS
jgi:hypothetical protein